MTDSGERLKFKVDEDFTVPKFPEAPEQPSMLVTATLWGLFGWGALMALASMFSLDIFMLFVGACLMVVTFVTRKLRKQNRQNKIDEWKRMVEYIWKGNSEFTKMKNMFILSGVEGSEANQLAINSMEAWNTQENKFVSFLVSSKNQPSNGVTLVQVYYEPMNFRKLRVVLEMTVPDFA